MASLQRQAFLKEMPRAQDSALRSLFLDFCGKRFAKQIFESIYASFCFCVSTLSTRKRPRIRGAFLSVFWNCVSQSTVRAATPKGRPARRRRINSVSHRITGEYAFAPLRKIKAAQASFQTTIRGYNPNERPVLF